MPIPALFIDFETRSRVSLKRHGISRYARDPSTYVLCLSYGMNPKEVDTWFPPVGGSMANFKWPPMPDLIRFAIEQGWEFHAHNASFEQHIWWYIMHHQLGWPVVPANKWRCTAAKAAYANCPRALEQVGIWFGLNDDGKDKEGHKLMKSMTTPSKATKKKPSTFTDDSDSHERLRKYNRQDVIAEINVDVRLPEWPEQEQRIWLLDQKINQRGIPVDVDLCKGAMTLFKRAMAGANREIATLTGDVVTKPTQNKRIVDWANRRGVNIGNLRETTVKETLKELKGKDQYADVSRVLEIRQEAGSAAVKKYQATIDCADNDGRARDLLLYGGAGPLRWAGKKLQPHNFKRGPSAPEDLCQLITLGDHEFFKDTIDKLVEADEARTEEKRIKKNKPDLKNFYIGHSTKKDEAGNALPQTDVIPLLKSAVKSIIRAPRGRKLIISDFSGIEARVLQWFAGNERALQMFRDGQDIYVDMACKIYGCQPEEILDMVTREPFPHMKDRRQIGKVAVLGLGYGMGAAKFVATVWAQVQIKIDLPFAQKVVDTFRESNPEVTNLWNRIERACVRTLRTGDHLRFGKLETRMDRKWLCIKLPSGRWMHYYGARLIKEDTNYGERYRIRYLQKKGLDETYGGKLVENIVQAASRDLLCDAMFRIDDAGHDIVMHVHDEVVVEVDAKDDKAEAFVHDAMRTVAPWAAGCPVGAETHTSVRYSK
jgi:DNA polymerase